VWESAVADGAPSPDLRCPFEHDCDSTGERERRSYRAWPRKCLLRPGPAEPMTSAARLTDDPTCRGPVTRGGPQWPSYVLDSPASARKTPTRGCQGTTALTSASAPRPVAAPCCGGLVRAALVDKSLKRHVTITVSGPLNGGGERYRRGNVNQYRNLAGELRVFKLASSKPSRSQDPASDRRRHDETSARPSAC